MAEKIVKKWTSKDKNLRAEFVEHRPDRYLFYVYQQSPFVKGSWNKSTHVQGAKSKADALKEYMAYIKMLEQPGTPTTRIKATLLTEKDVVAMALREYQRQLAEETDHAKRAEIKDHIKNCWNTINPDIPYEDPDQMETLESKLAVLAGKPVVKKKRSSKQVLRSLKSHGNKLLKHEARLKERMQKIQKQLDKLKVAKTKHKDRIQKHVTKMKDRAAKKDGSINPKPAVPAADLAKKVVKKK